MPLWELEEGEIIIKGFGFWQVKDMDFIFADERTGGL